MSREKKENNKKMIEELFNEFSLEEQKGILWGFQNMDIVRPFIESSKLSDEEMIERMKKSIRKNDYAAFFILSYKQFYDNHMGVES